MLINHETLKKVGFNIGWDYYVYSTLLPKHAEEFADIMAGYKEAEARAGKKKNCDRYERKCLLLRLNAYSRGKAFDENIDPGYLRQIDNDRCPITNVVLTHGCQADTDWSVDRIYNESGYTVGNLIIVSTKANRIKGAKDYAQILSIVEAMQADPKLDTGLNWFEWMRWLSIVSKVIPYEAIKDNKAFIPREGNQDRTGKSPFVFTVAPCVILPPAGIFTIHSDIVQIIIASKVISLPDIKNSFNKVMGGLTPEGKASFQQVVKTAQKVADKNQTTNPLDIWFNNNLFRKFESFYVNYCMNDTFIDALREATRFLKITNVDAPNLLTNLDYNAWHVDTKGYIHRAN